MSGFLLKVFSPRLLAMVLSLGLLGHPEAPVLMNIPFIHSFIHPAETMEAGVGGTEMKAPDRTWAPPHPHVPAAGHGLAHASAR